MKAAFEETAASMGTKATVDITIMYPGYKRSEGDEVVEVAKRAIESIGREPKLLQSGGGSDANIIAGMGIPTVNLAVGYKLG